MSIMFIILIHQVFLQLYIVFIISGIDIGKIDCVGLCFQSMCANESNCIMFSLFKKKLEGKLPQTDCMSAFVSPKIMARAGNALTL